MSTFTCIKHVRLLVGDGREAIQDGVLVLENGDTPEQDSLRYCGSFENFHPDFAEGASVAELDLSCGEYTILPGLINTHAHLDLELPYLPYYLDKWGDAYRALVVYRRASEALRCGVTTIRGVGIVGQTELAVRNAFKKGLLWGPRIVSCGSPLVPHAGHGFATPGSVQCSGADEFVRGLRGQLAQGVDQIKLMYTGGLAGANEGTMDVQMTEAEVAACVEVAHSNSKKISAHLSNDHAIAQAVRLGMDGIEHGYTISEETAQLMAEKNVFYTPTLCVSHCNDYMRKLGVPDYTLIKQEAAANAHISSCRRAVEAGVTICTGTDLLPSDPIGGTTPTIRETELLVEDVGLSPLEAIKAATYNGARLCGVDKITGTLEAGKCGDFIIVEGKPDQDIHDLRKLRLVSRGCRLVWSELPVFTKDNFKILPPGVSCTGGVFKRW